MLVDSHCHLDYPGLADRLPEVLNNMKSAGVGCALCVGVTLEDFPAVRNIAEQHDHLFASVGVHPDNTDCAEPDVDTLCQLATHPKVVAIGETGLDYYRLQGDLEWQRNRFRTHIAAARQCGKPLIIHTRASSEDTIRIMREENAGEAGGVMHCFTESAEVAKHALDLGFYISFSGIITFKNAADLREVVKMVPHDRLLIETDSPYLAPVPYRGKTNEPAYVAHVANLVSELINKDIQYVKEITSSNFFNLFKGAAACKNA